MAEAGLLAAAFASSACGMAWLALALEVHWRQVRGPGAPPAGAERTLRWLGAAALLGSLLFCLAADHPSMAALVWVMALTASALLVAFTLAYRPRWLAPLGAWLPPRARARPEPRA